MSSETESKIKPFYSNTNVLITGGTGFFGKILIQKLLRVCDDIEGIYLIIRRKKGLSAAERLEETFRDVVFDRLKSERPDFSAKIHLVEGDCSTVRLGLDEQNLQLLKDKINIVFHCAASMSMGAKLKDAIDTNVLGIRELLDICHEMHHLKSVVYVSTAYSNCTQYVVEERLYDTPIRSETLINLAKEVKPEVLEDMTPGLLQKWPNTYCYSKAVAEDMLRERSKGLPVGVFRPSIVMPTYLDPMPGWTSNIYGPMGALFAAGLGILRIYPGDTQKQTDLVPVDLCVNALICVAWEVARKKQQSPSEIPVYNYSGGPKRNMLWQTFADVTKQYEYPASNPLWVTVFFFVQNAWCYNLLWFLMHTVPGYLIDAYLFITGKKTRMAKVYDKLWKMCNVLSYFTYREWDIINENVEKLRNNLEEVDQKLFPFDMDMMNNTTYLKNACTGVKLYLLKESLDNVDADKQNYRRLERIHNTVKYLLILIMLVILYKFLSLFMSVL